jgi:putative spermidine/putrescine transport system permease protein
MSATTPTRRHAVSAFLYEHVRLRLALLLAAPLFWLGLVYIVALAALLITAFWTVDSFTGEVRIEWTLDNIVTVLTTSIYQSVTLRTLGIALLVTLIDVVLALPISFFMAKIAGPRLQRALLIAVLTPLWASYLVKAFAWRSVLSDQGIFQWAASRVGLDTPGYGLTAVIITQAYIWLPYVILPIFAGLERVPNSLLDASGDLGGRPGHTFRRVILPLVLPAAVAGSIFTFSLTLGDYIAPQLVSSTQFIGNVVYNNVGVANNLPLAAAFATVPVVIMLVYLLIARRLGAFESL